MTIPIAVALTISIAWLPGHSAAPQISSGPAIAAQSDPDTDRSEMSSFTSNGCSGFREARFYSCCFVHDFAFWAGGTWGDRGRADRALRGCLLDVSHDWIVTGIGYMLVRLATIPGYFVADGWGRAWRDLDRGRFAPLTAQQQRQVQNEKQRVCQSLVLDPKTGRYRVDETRTIRLSEARQICEGDPPPPSASYSRATSR
jgi:hypothetical protein